jgi:hypothetical protein
VKTILLLSKSLKTNQTWEKLRLLTSAFKQGLREAIADKIIDIYHLNTKNMISDIGTKALVPLTWDFPTSF